MGASNSNQKQKEENEQINTDTHTNKNAQSQDFKEDYLKFDRLLKEQAQIRQFFRPQYSPFHFISYKSFVQSFPFNLVNFQQQNLNIIDVQLRYRLYIRNQMARYKWLPILAVSPLIFRSTFLLITVPYLYTTAFDYYLEGFFVWLHQDQLLINMREEFATKLTKVNNIQRRVDKWKKLEGEFRRTNQEQSNQVLQPPLRYIKFGEYTDHVFHTNIGGVEQSCILQTSLFHTYQLIKAASLSSFSTLADHIKYLSMKFWQYRRDMNRNVGFLNVQAIIGNPLIKQAEKFSNQTNISLSIRQFIEMWAYITTGKVILSTFSLSRFTNVSVYHDDMLDPQKYNVKSNLPDLLCYWGVLLLPKAIRFFVKRK